MIDVPSVPGSHGIAPAAHRRSSSDRGRDGLKVDSHAKHEKDLARRRVEYCDNTMLVFRYLKLSERYPGWEFYQADRSRTDDMTAFTEFSTQTDTIFNYGG